MTPPGLKWGIPGDVSCKSFRILIGVQGEGVGMTDRRNRRDRVIAVIGSSAVCLLIAVLLAGDAATQSPPTQQTKTTSAGNSAPAGIPRDLARFRAQQLKDIRYQLSFTITPRADSINGHEELRFVQNADDLHPSKPTPGSPGTRTAGFCRSGWIFVKDPSAA